MDRASLRVCRCVKALRGTGVGLPVVLLPELELVLPAPVAVVVGGLRPEELALNEAAELAAVPDNTPALPVRVDVEERGDVELMLDDEVLLLARFNTDGLALSDEPLLLELGVSNEPAVDAPDADPAPEEGPPGLDPPAATEPVWEDWMYRSCRLPGLR